MVLNENATEFLEKYTDVGQSHNEVIMLCFEPILFQFLHLPLKNVLQESFATRLRNFFII